MKTRSRFTPLALASLSLVTPAFALISIDFVPVGNAGNAADTTGYGAVSYAYQIGKYEVTNSQYAAFLNAKGATNSNGIYNSSMASYGITQTGSSGSFSYNVSSGYANKPVVYVSWFDAARFSNWLGNGQGSGNMETGAYTLNNATSGIVTVNVGATVYIPSEDEWYKAAYYNPATTTYSLYPNGQNTITTADANYNNSVGSTTTVGTYTSDPSPYGTFDQAGNVGEWDDGIISTGRVRRGGRFDNTDAAIASTYRSASSPTSETNSLGFRVVSTSASVATTVPEPSALVIMGLSALGLAARRRRVA